MTGRRRLRWLIARANRERSEIYYWHLGLVRRLTWPIRDTSTWWYMRRLTRAMRVGQIVISA